MSAGHPPVTPFWQGYERTPEMANKLVEAVRAALYAHPTQRFAQILMLAGIGGAHTYDEDLAEALDTYSKKAQP